jgi:DNA-binding GntR family transcriptional regulator
MSEDGSVARSQFPRLQLSDEVASYVRELIVSGQLRSGQFIRQEQIAEELELSATPVREGLLTLKGEGFVQLKPRRGFVVAPLSAADVRDLFTAQELLAGELVATHFEAAQAAAQGGTWTGAGAVSERRRAHG